MREEARNELRAYLRNWNGENHWISFCRSWRVDRLRFLYRSVLGFGFSKITCGQAVGNREVRPLQSFRGWWQRSNNLGSIFRILRSCLAQRDRPSQAWPITRHNKLLAQGHVFQRQTNQFRAYLIAFFIGLSDSGLSSKWPSHPQATY